MCRLSSPGRTEVEMQNTNPVSFWQWVKIQANAILSTFPTHTCYSAIPVPYETPIRTIKR